MNILFLRRKGEGCVAAPRHYHAFEQEVSKHTNCLWAGRGWNLYQQIEPFDKTIKRVMPEVDWVIDRERDEPLPKRGFMVGAYLSDIHGRGAFGVHGTEDYIDSVNNVGYDALFMRYLELHGVESHPEIFLDELKPAIYFLPWSIDVSEFKPKSEKKWDVTFIGSVGKHYPLRKRIWKRIPYFCTERGLRLLRTTRPRGSSSFSQPDMFPSAFFGKRYSKALSETRFFIFGCSKYRYPLLKYFEGMASGCTVFADEPSSARELGFKDGENYVKINEENWEDKLDYYLENPEKAKWIAENGRKLIVKYHSHQVRAKTFIRILEEFR